VPCYLHCRLLEDEPAIAKQTLLAEPKMKSLTFIPGLVVLAVSAVGAFAPSAFVPRMTSSISSSSSALQMVAEDAKVILVTGASRGLGRAIALEFGALGQKVVVNYAGSKDAAEKTVEDIKAAGGDAVAVHLGRRIIALRHGQHPGPPGIVIIGGQQARLDVRRAGAEICFYVGRY